MTTVAWWHCFAGIAGDMALGSLVDAGADLALIERELVALPVGGWSLEASQVQRGGLAATQVRVRAQDTSVVRTHSHIVGLITEARLPERARRRALDTFARLAEAEGRLHNRPPSQVHFHEVGGIDAIVDIVGTSVALEVLGVDEVWASPLAQGTGMIRSAHGLLPNPSPAVVELLRGAPTYGTAFPYELTTPTGAALVAALASGFGPMPAMEVTASGYGAGTRELDGMPNVVQVVLGHPAPSEGPAVPLAGDGTGQQVALVETNLDDVTGEVLAHTVARLLAAGAHDAWITPIIAKKGRPAHILSALVDPVEIGAISRVMASETGSLGVRASQLTRWPLVREVGEVAVEGYPVRVKRSANRIKAEHDDVVRVAELLRLPAREVARRAEEAAYRQPPDGPDGDGATPGGLGTAG
ncbi:MAG: nickel pincer cofactor biosynthesis protein LarC [Acidimicrobiales bacterium]